MKMKKLCYRYKLVVADVVIETLNPIRKRLFELNQEPQYLEEVLRKGSEKAANIAHDCWHEVREKVGFGNNVFSSSYRGGLDKIKTCL